MTALGHLLHLLRGQWFRRLFSVRVMSQFADGVFQVALTSYVLFSPERQPSPGAIAGVLAVVLLPFSVLGPFAGVLLDRWPRRQVLAYANFGRLVIVAALAALVARGVPDPVFYVVVVLCLSVNRFVLAGLSASLPHTVTDDDLVTANALTPTLGAIAAFSGAGLGSLLRSSTSDVKVLLAAALGYGAAGALALRIPRLLLGPDLAPGRPRVSAALRNVALGLVEGFGHLGERRSALYAIVTVAGQRFLYGLTTVGAVLLYRGYFHTPDESDAAFTDLAVLVGVSGAGFVLAAVLTPVVVERFGTRPWILVLLGVAAAVQVFPTMLYEKPALLVAGFLLGLSAQGVKICADTLVQLGVDDEFRGRVFSVYDVLFNVAFVGAAAAAAISLPDNGKSYVVLGAVALCYAATAAAYARVAKS
jgi:MFS family permease